MICTMPGTAAVGPRSTGATLGISVAGCRIFWSLAIGETVGALVSNRTHQFHTASRRLGSRAGGVGLQTRAAADFARHHASPWSKSEAGPQLQPVRRLTPRRIV